MLSSVLLDFLKFLGPQSVMQWCCMEDPFPGVILFVGFTSDVVVKRAARQRRGKFEEEQRIQ